MKEEHKSLANAAILLVGLALVMMASPALAQGVNTAGSTMGNLNDWLSTWIPLACGLAIIVAGLLLLIGMLPMAWFGRAVMGMVLIGSSTYIVSLFGIGV